MERVVREDERWHVFSAAGGMVDFVPKSWIEWMPNLGLDRKNEPQSWFVMRFQIIKSTLHYYVEVRKMSDAKLRRRIVDSLLEKGTTFGFAKTQSKGASDTYTRVSGMKRPVMEWSDDSPPDAEELEQAVRAKLEAVWKHVGPLGDELRRLVTTDGSGPGQAGA